MSWAGGAKSSLQHLSINSGRPFMQLRRPLQSVMSRRLPAILKACSGSPRARSYATSSVQDGGASSSKLRAQKQPSNNLRRSIPITKRASDRAERKMARRGSYNEIVTAYCGAEQFDLGDVAQILREQKVHLDPDDTAQLDHVVHFRIPAEHSRPVSNDETSSTELLRDVFIFPSGTIVGWGVSEEVLSSLATSLLSSAAKNRPVVPAETEHLEYIEDSTREFSLLKGETIILGTLQRTAEADSGSEVAPSDPTNVKIAFSWGIARSTKLAALESLLSDFNESTRSIPTIMSQGRKSPYGRSFVLQKTGQILTIRAQLNLYSELTDSLPDLFWDSRHELRLESYFDQVSKALDIEVRIRDLNRRLDYSGEIVRELKEQLDTNHGLRLEWIIIGLIAVEVVFGFWREWRDWRRESLLEAEMGH